MGDGTVLENGVESRPTPSTVTGGHTFTRIESGREQTCGIATDGNTYCWGLNSQGQIGDGASTFGSRDTRPTPVAVAGGYDFTDLSLGLHSCGRSAAGWYCWGWNEFGELGDGSITSTPTPVPVNGGQGFDSLSVGLLHTCGLTGQGAAYCWGLNDRGQLGDGTTINRLAPVAVAGGHRFVALSAGNYHTCGLTPAGGVLCWGSNDAAQLGDGTTVGSLEPVPVLRPSTP
jgi:alpha-tubulin suppressor-like RCC1 family protein